MERCLRDVVETSEYASLKTGCTVTSIDEDVDWVHVHFTDNDGNNKTIRGRFLAGADGKVGFTRKMYLEPKGVVMEEIWPHKLTFVSTNWKVLCPTLKTHPDFPLWKKGYTPDQVIKAFFPSGFYFVANPDRLGAAGNIGEVTAPDGLWHQEFEVKEGEDKKEMMSVEKVNEILWPYWTHPGSRYGLAKDVRFPDDCIEMINVVSYTFEARTCNKWHVGRTLLLGDAAHVFPPYGGQGVRCGMIDAVDLSWRLALLARESSLDHERLFAGWELERRTDVDRALAYTLRNGAFLTEKDPWKIFKRDWGLWLMSFIPSWRRDMERPKTDLVQYPYSDGMAFLVDMEGGKTMSQVFCRRVGKDGKDEGDVIYSDDVVFEKEKTGLFQLMQSVDELEDTSFNQGVLKRLEIMSHGLVHGAEVTTVVNDPDATLSSKLPGDASGAVVRVARGHEFLKSSLSKDQPITEDYDEMRIKKSMSGKRFAIVRADRMMYAVCSDYVELEKALKSMGRVVLGR